MKIEGPRNLPYQVKQAYLHQQKIRATSCLWPWLAQGLGLALVLLTLSCHYSSSAQQKPSSGNVPGQPSPGDQRLPPKTVPPPIAGNPQTSDTTVGNPPTAHIQPVLEKIVTVGTVVTDCVLGSTTVIHKSNNQIQGSSELQYTVAFTNADQVQAALATAQTQAFGVATTTPPESGGVVYLGFTVDPSGVAQPFYLKRTGSTSGLNPAPIATLLISFVDSSCG